MSKHRKPPWWRRIWRRPDPARVRHWDTRLACEDAPAYVTMAPGWGEPTEGEIAQWVKDITDPAIPAVTDDTTFDLIRYHPYAPELHHEREGFHDGDDADRAGATMARTEPGALPGYTPGLGQEIQPSPSRGGYRREEALSRQA